MAISTKEVEGAGASFSSLTLSIGACSAHFGRSLSAELSFRKESAFHDEAGPP